MTRTESSQMAAAAAGKPTRAGLALVIIATAQLMVVLDGTIVNVALPHIQQTLNFSGNGLEWVVNAYALAFGGLLLLGGRSGDLLGRRRVFVAGMIVFSAASLAGGFATSQWWLLSARAVQGAGAAIIAPTSLSLVTTTFTEGKDRNQAFGVVGAMAGVGVTVGLLLGGLLTSYISWRWVLFVNVPVGVIAAVSAPLVLAESPRRTGRFDVAGAVTGTAGVSLLVYGLIQATPGLDGVSHWGGSRVIGSLAAAAVLLVLFAVIELRSSAALMPPRVLASAGRSGSYLIALCVGTAISGVFFFLTLFLQDVWGYSPIRTGLAYVPMSLAIIAGAAVSAPLLAKVGARVFLVTGGILTAAGMFWIAAVIGVQGDYLGAMVGPTLLSGVGLGLIFTPMTVVGMSGLVEEDVGAASSLVNAGRQIGGAVGLAVLGTIAWTAVSHSVRVHTVGGPGAPSAAVLDHALATGFARAFIAAAAVMLLASAIAAAAIRVKRSEIEAAAIASGAVRAPAAAHAAAAAEADYVPGRTR